MSTEKEKRGTENVSPEPWAGKPASQRLVLGMDTWHALARELRGHASGLDHEDDVQEALLRLFQWLGADPSAETARQLGRVFLFALRVDRSRRLRHQLLGEGDTLLPVRINEVARINVRQLDPSLTAALGRRGVDLLQEILDGTRRNRPLADRLATTPHAIRIRRERIRRILERMAREINPDQE